MSTVVALQPGSRLPGSQKFIECFLAGVAAIDVLSMGTQLLPRFLLAKLQAMSMAGFYGIEIMIALCPALVLFSYWQFSEKRAQSKTIFFHPIMTGILRYWLAFGISTYGFAKILKTQFAHSFQRDDTVVHDLNGMNLTWQYFSHSYAMAAIIGLTQIGGAILLLFRRTTLLGTVILLPVLINILLINLFYHIAIGAFFNAIVFTMGLLYLLSLHWDELKKLFINSADNLPPLRWGKLKFLVKPLPLVAGFFMIYQYTSQLSSSKIAGKWTVDFMVRYGDTVKTGAWLTDASIWSNVYLEEAGAIAVCANPYLFEADKSLEGSYHYNDSMKILQLTFPNRQVNVAVSKIDGDKMEWHSILKKDSLFVVMRRTARP